MEEPKVFFHYYKIQVDEEEFPCSPESSDDSVKEAEAKKHDKENEESPAAKNADAKSDKAETTPTSANKGLKKRRRVDDE